MIYGHTTSPARSWRLLTALILWSALAGMALFAPRADAYDQVCGSGPPGYQGGGGYCNLGIYYPIDFISESANDGSIAVYRATASYTGAPSASGTEYYSSATYFAQSFHCYGGYPAEHNRHSYAVYIYWVSSAACV